MMPIAQGAPVQTRHSPRAKASPLLHSPSGNGLAGTGIVRLRYLAPDITQAILDGRRPGDLTPEKLLVKRRTALTLFATDAGSPHRKVRYTESTGVAVSRSKSGPGIKQGW
jgi:hypothetical protein